MRSYRNMNLLSADEIEYYTSIRLFERPEPKPIISGGYNLKIFSIWSKYIQLLMLTHNGYTPEN